MNTYVYLLIGLYNEDCFLCEVRAEVQAVVDDTNI